VKCIGHVGTNAHNAFFCSGLATLNVNRESMARYGFSPPTRVFEAAGAGACLVTDRWKGIDLFLEPNREVLVAADGEQVAVHLDGLTPGRAREIANRARGRVLAHHTYAQRALQVHEVLEGSSTQAGAAG
jgi:spore maturation protein CgeB